MDPVLKHFEEEAHEYDQIILRLIPYYPQMLDALLGVIPFDSAAPIRVLDLGCGTGTISRKVLESFSNARVTCLDAAANMITMARAKLAEYPHTRFQVADFNDYAFDESYDVIVSSLALHHLVSDQSKIGFYRKIFDALNPNGVFYNADVVLASRASVQELYIRKWKEFMRRQVSDEEIEHKWMVTYATEDRPARLIDHLDWLKQIGLHDLDVIWKYYNFTVYGGSKPALCNTVTP